MNLLPRMNMPVACVQCGNDLHRKSEHYCSELCASAGGKDAPPFLSKWKIRKRKMLNDPMARLRNRTRKRTRDLVRWGRLKQKPCIVCGGRNVIAHHEDYLNPFKVIWICELHHKEYHDGKIALFNGRLRWDPARLDPKRSDGRAADKNKRECQVAKRDSGARETKIAILAKAISFQP